MIEPLAQLHATLKSHGQSLTKPRKMVFEALQGREPLTMHEVVAMCQETADRASIYRTVALFERIGIIQRLQVGWKYRLELGDSFRHHHHHLHCVSCDRTIPLPEDMLLENRLRDLAAAQDFSPQDHQVEIRGLCRTCQALYTH